MKKLIVFALMLSLITAAILVPQTVSAAGLDYYAPKCTEAPVIDGKITDGEYQLMASYEKTPEEFILTGNADEIGKCDWYATWDDSYIYIAVVATCNEHIAHFDNASELYIFNAHHVMTSMLPDDPAQDKYLSPTGEVVWEWAAAAGSGFSREWTIIRNSDTGENANDNHFGAVTKNADYQYTVVSGGGYDVYEQRIPWAAIGKDDAKVGSVAGIAITIGLSDTGKGYDGEGNKLNVSTGLKNGKAFSEHARIHLEAAKLMDSKSTESFIIIEETSVPEETSEAASEDTSSAVSEVESEVSTAVSEQESGSESVETSVISDASAESVDDGASSSSFPSWAIALIVVAIVAVIGLVVFFIIKKKKN